MRCDQCKHWKSESNEQEWEAKAAGFGECSAVQPRWKLMDAASDALAKATGADRYDSDTTEAEFANARTAALKAAKAYVQDGSEYRAELFTAPEFFCALFNPKQP